MRSAVGVNPSLAREASRRTVLAAVLAMVAMLFAGFTAAYIERQASQPSWPRTPLPPEAFAAAALLVASSVVLEIGRRRGAGRKWIAATLALGAAFAFCQFLAWQSLAAEGVFLRTHAHASFFYTLTVVHAVHVAGGAVAFLAAASRPSLLPACATYWHFLGGTWIYVLLVLGLL